MTDFKWSASLVLATTMVSTLNAETRCPGNAASLPFLLANHYQMIVAVSVNHSGPYDFLVDTGMQVTGIDPSWPLNFTWCLGALRWSQALGLASPPRTCSWTFSKPVRTP
jgi:hypothetical protein